jgi:hypothetical protein
MFSKALENKNRFVFLRLSDGESYGFTDNNMLIERQEMHWWGEVLDPQTRSTIREEFLDILNREIDLLGIPTPNKFVHYLGYTYRAEMNNAPAEKNAMKRNAITAQGLRAAVAKEKLINTIFCEDQINLLMFTKKYLKELSHFAEKTVVISGFSEDVVTSQLKIQNLQVIEIPTHNQYKENDGVVKGSLPRVYPVIKDKIKQMVSPGTLVIISAGFIGKIFASEVGELGGVTLDLGHQLDLILKDRHA